MISIFSRIRVRHRNLHRSYRTIWNGNVRSKFKRERKRTNLGRTFRWNGGGLPTGPLPPPPDPKSVWKPLAKAAVGAVGLVVGVRVLTIIGRGGTLFVLGSPIGVAAVATGAGALIAAHHVGLVTLDVRSIPMVLFVIISLGISGIVVKDMEIAALQKLVKRSVERLRKDDPGALYHVVERSELSEPTFEKEPGGGDSNMLTRRIQLTIRLRRSKAGEDLSYRTARVIASRDHPFASWALEAVTVE